LKARGSLHSGQAKRDPESSPARSGIRAILDSGFRRNDGVSDFCKKLKGNEFSNPVDFLLIFLRNRNKKWHADKRIESPVNGLKVELSPYFPA